MAAIDLPQSALAYLSVSATEADRTAAGVQICQDLRSGSASILQLVNIFINGEIEYSNLNMHGSSNCEYRTGT